MDISKLSASELEELAARIPEEIQKRKLEEKEKVLQEVAALAAARGYKLDDLVGEKATAPTAKKKGSRKPARIKYRHPQQPDLTWTGRGRKPGWVTEWLAAGQKIEALTI